MGRFWDRNAWGRVFWGSLVVGGAALAACVSEAPPATSNDGGADEAGAGTDGGAEGGGGTDGGGVDAQAKPGTLLASYVTDVENATFVHLAFGDNGELCFVSSGFDSTSFKVAGQSYPFAGGVAVGKIGANGALAWLKVYNVVVNPDSIDIAVAPDGDVWLLGGGTDSGAHQDWNGTPVAKKSPSGRGDIFWTHLSGADGSFKSAYQIATATGGIDQSGGVQETTQAVRLARVGNQLVGAFGHRGTVQLPSASGDLAIVPAGSNQAVTVFRADPTNGLTSFHDTYTGGFDSVSPGGISVLADGNLAIALNFWGSKGQTDSNSQGGVSVTKTGAGTAQFFLAAKYSPTNTPSLVGAYAQDGDSPDAGFGATEKFAKANSIAIDASGRIEIGGWFEGANVPMHGTLFQDDGSGDLYIMSVASSGAVLDHPDFATNDTDNAAAAGFEPSGQLVVGGLYGGTINRLPMTPSASSMNAGLAQFSLFVDGGVAWNTGFLTSGFLNNQPAPALAIQPTSGIVAFGAGYSHQIDFGKGLTDVPNGGISGIVILQRAP